MPDRDDDDDDDDGDYYRPPAKSPSRPSKTPKPTETPKPAETPAPEPSSVPSPAPSPAAAPPVSVEQFSDVSEDAWYYEPVSYVLENSLMVGMTDSEFSPEAEITRAMFVTVLYRMAGEPDLSQEILGYPFRDVEGDSWYANAVYWARLNGIVEGYSPEEFIPHQGITREQMAVMVYRYAKLKQYGTEADTAPAYTDASGISDYAREAVNWNAANALMQGHEDNTFDPSANTTRAQAAVIFEKLHQNCG